jgi:hypothetical protein
VAFLLITFGKIVANKLSYVNLFYYIYTVTIKQEQMTKQEFTTKYRSCINSDVETRDVLLLVASNLSDLQHFGLTEEANEKINSIKELIFDYMSVIRKVETV